MLIRVKVKIKQRKQGIAEKKAKKLGGASVFEVAVIAKPEQGKANEEALSLLARHFNLLPNKLKIVKGHTTPNKIVEVFLD